MKIIGNVCTRDALHLEKGKKITIALPVFEEPEIVAKFIEGNKEILQNIHLLL